MAQKNKLRPFTNGIISLITGDSGACSTSVAPARAEIATAPILIQ
jgi:hypothetical protein